jgi:hypothetical protein
VTTGDTLTGRIADANRPAGDTPSDILGTARGVDEPSPLAGIRDRLPSNAPAGDTPSDILGTARGVNFDVSAVTDRLPSNAPAGDTPSDILGTARGVDEPSALAGVRDRLPSNAPAGDTASDILGTARGVEFDASAITDRLPSNEPAGETIGDIFGTARSARRTPDASDLPDLTLSLGARTPDRPTFGIDRRDLDVDADDADDTADGVEVVAAESDVGGGGGGSGQLTQLRTRSDTDTTRTVDRAVTARPGQRRGNIGIVGGVVDVGAGDTVDRATPDYGLEGGTLPGGSLGGGVDTDPANDPTGIGGDTGGSDTTGQTPDEANDPTDITGGGNDVTVDPINDPSEVSDPDDDTDVITGPDPITEPDPGTGTPPSEREREVQPILLRGEARVGSRAFEGAGEATVGDIGTRLDQPSRRAPRTPVRGANVPEVNVDNPRRPRGRRPFDDLDGEGPAAIDTAVDIEDVQFSAQGLTSVDQQLQDNFGGLDEP